jgi:hypothetical protein
LTEVAEIFCPQCGYDLRGIESARCPECGHEIDRTGLAKSQIPWTWRGQTIGRWRAYWRTVGLGSWRIGWLAGEVNRPVDGRDARRFATITALIAGLPVAVLLIATMISEGGTNSLNPLSGPSHRQRQDSLLPPAADAQIPYAAGMTAWPVMPIAVVLFVWLVTRSTRLWFYWSGGGVSAQQRERAQLLSYYAAAPLVFTLLGVASISYLLAITYRQRSVEEWMEIAFIGGGCGIIFLCFAWYWFNALRLLRRTTRASALRMIWTAFALPGTWYACGVIVFVGFVWVAGYLWLMVESLIG